MRLSTRIALVTSVLVPLLVLSAGLLLFRLVVHDQRTQRDDTLRRRAAVLAPQAQSLLRATAKDNDRQEQSRSAELFLSALDDGVRLTTTEQTYKAGPQPGPDVKLPASARKPIGVSEGGRHWRAVSVPVVLAKPRTAATLWLFTADDEARGREKQLRNRVFLVAAFAVPAAALAGFAAASRATKSLRQLRARAAGLDPSTDATRDVHVPTGVGDVDDLGKTLATLLGRYDEQAARTASALDTARSFAAVAAHELRTPLTSMRTNLDVLDRHPDLDAADRTEILADLSGEHARVLGLLRDLGALAQGDLIGDDAFGPVDLAAVAQAAVDTARVAYPRADIALTTLDDALVRGWETGLRMVLDNLIGNAVVHGGATTRVRVDVRTETGADRVRITVADDGPGIPPELRAAVFERFRRGAASPGSGLGLTLVAQQTAVHGGTVELADADPGPGLLVRIDLPVHPPAATAADRHDWLSGTGPGPQGFHKNRG
ncbi:hypothetical protein GCM10023205_16550 [Yinghuangia aomiensis]|uniref:histidine kinase n=1 Tax=Yinghuangia aomiensis TaxID=676205 RepID=A0ABP9H3G4_9ACTN